MAEQEIITAEEYETSTAEDTDKDIEVLDWDATMQQIAGKANTTIRVPKNKEFNRKQVVEAFSTAFELIGGVPRLALWAHSNPDDFYKLYARLLPSQASSALGESNEMVVKHVLPPSPLDE